MSNTTKQGQHDGTRFSTALTPLREALEKWQAFCREAKGFFFGQWSEFNRIDDPEKLRREARRAVNAAQLLAGVLEELHWPQFDQLGSLKTDERAHEAAARYLQTGHPEFAWGLLQGAMRRAFELKGAKVCGFDLDLSAYYQAEAYLVWDVLRQHYDKKT